MTEKKNWKGPGNKLFNKTYINSQTLQDVETLLNRLLKESNVLSSPRTRGSRGSLVGMQNSNLCPSPGFRIRGV